MTTSTDFTRATEFQIPMRGNESTMSGGTFAARDAFQIPMRGNETVSAIAAIATSGRFQIPMRGNEVVLYGHSRRHDPVPNPHEG